MPQVTLKMNFTIPGDAPTVEIQHAIREVSKALIDDPTATWFPIRAMNGDITPAGECHLSIMEE